MPLELLIFTEVFVENFCLLKYNRDCRMGAYLSSPKTDKTSIDERNELVLVGASSMQGWRNSQEVCTACILLLQYCNEKQKFL